MTDDEIKKAIKKAVDEAIIQLRQEIVNARQAAIDEIAKLKKALKLP
jgi:hypothetical protein